MEIKVLGSGCMNCNKLENNVRTAVEEAGVDATIEKVSDMKAILSYGVMRTPALVVNGKVVVMGKVATVEEIKKFL